MNDTESAWWEKKAAYDDLDDHFSIFHGLCVMRSARQLIFYWNHVEKAISGKDDARNRPAKKSRCFDLVKNPILSLSML